jgi:hypothetical protein
MSDDLAARLRACDIGICDEAAAEIDRLRRWKAEATAVIERWDALWELLGRPGRLGEFQQTGVHDEFMRLRAQVERIRAAVNDPVTDAEIAAWGAQCAADLARPILARVEAALDSEVQS